MENVRGKVETPKIQANIISRVNSFKPSRYQEDLIHISFKLDQSRERQNTFQPFLQGRIILNIKIVQEEH